MVDRAQVALLADIRVNTAIAAAVGHQAAKHASIRAVVRAIQLAFVALFLGALRSAVAAVRSPLALGVAAAIDGVVVLLSRAARRDWHCSIAAVALLAP